MKFDHVRRLISVVSGLSKYLYPSKALVEVGFVQYRFIVTDLTVPRLMHDTLNDTQIVSTCDGPQI